MSEHTPGPWKVRASAEYPAQYQIYNCRAWGDEPEGQANTTLIAAAPDMLVALENMMSEERSLIPEVRAREMMAAIAKAKGETPPA